MSTLKKNIEKLNELNTSLEQTLYGTDTGGKSYYDEFWDSFQNEGDPKRYSYAFYGWNRNIFYPKHDIICSSNMGSMFHFFEQFDSNPFDLSARLKECGVILDTSGATTGGSYVFYYTSFSKIPKIDLTGLSDGEKLTYMFGENFFLVEIEKLIVKEGNVFNVSFSDCTKLEKIEIEGVIGSIFDIKSSPLNKESIESIINHLSNNVVDTLILKKTAVINAFGENYENNADWLKITTPKITAGWTINLS